MIPAVPGEQRTLSSAALRTRVASGLTTYGWMLFVIGLSLFASGRAWGRISLGSLLVHPYLVLVGLTFPLLAMGRLHLIPTRMVMGLSAFAGLYFASTFSGGVQISEGIKIAATVVTILSMAMLVRSWEDFSAGTLGMCLAVGTLALSGVTVDAASYSGRIEAVDNANRNAYSLYALPCVLLGSYVFLNSRRDSFFIKGLLAVTILATTLCICLNVNRSGWIGLAAILVMLTYERSLKSAIAFGIAGGLIGWVVVTFFGVSHIEERVASTRTGLESDIGRWNLIVNSFFVGVENPLLGVSPEGLTRELARRLGYSGGQINTHNVFAHVIGGSGVVCFLLLFYCGSTMWRWRPSDGAPAAATVGFRKARRLLRYVLILWMVRGFFTHEIIYSPSFNMAIGLCLGLCALRLPPRFVPRRAPTSYRSAADHPSI